MAFLPLYNPQIKGMPHSHYPTCSLGFVVGNVFRVVTAFIEMTHSIRCIICPEIFSNDVTYSSAVLQSKPSTIFVKMISRVISENCT